MYAIRSYYGYSRSMPARAKSEAANSDAKDATMRMGASAFERNNFV